MHDLLNTCRHLEEFEFVVVHEWRYRSAFKAFGLPTYSVVIPRSLRFFASLALLPLIARRTRAAAVHCEISAVPWLIGVPASLTVDDLYFLIDRGAGGRTLRQRVMQVYWERLFTGSIRRATICKTISETTAADMRRLVSPDLSIVLAPPPIVVPPDLERTRRPPAGAEALRLLFVGSVVPRRNLPFLLSALRSVRRPWHLDVVGSLWWGADELGPLSTDERVRFHGYVPDAERERLMAEAHLLVAPSRYEGFGYPVAEAMGRGLPVLASDAASFREFVPPAWRFGLDDPALLASMIDRLDADRLSEMSDAAPAAVARFSPANHRERHRELFSRLVPAPGTAHLPAADGSEWRPDALARARSLVRRTLIATLGDGVEARVRAEYHRALRGVGRFGPPEDEATRAVLAAIAANARTILDIGANVGRYAWFLWRHARPDARLYALEPHPGAARLLRSALRRLPGCNVLEVAAADQDGVAELVVPEGPFGASLSALSWVRNGQRDEDQPVLAITTRRLDGLIADGTVTVTAPVFMKIDVEGAEARVLRGAAGLLGRHRPVIYFECQSASAARQGETPRGVWDELERAGYQVFAKLPAGFVRVAQVHPDVANYLAIPDLPVRRPDELDDNLPMDAAALIAILDSWATRAAKA